MKTNPTEPSPKAATPSLAHQALSRRMRGVRFARMRCRQTVWPEPFGTCEAQRISCFAFRHP